MSPSPVHVPFEHRLRDSSGKRENGRVSAPFNERKSFFLDHRVRLVISRSAIYRVGLRYTCSSYEPLLNLSFSCLLFEFDRKESVKKSAPKDQDRGDIISFGHRLTSARESIDPPLLDFLWLGEREREDFVTGT